MNQICIEPRELAVSLSRDDQHGKMKITPVGFFPKSVQRMALAVKVCYVAPAFHEAVFEAA